jgi:lysophospholipase L1-like esterase
VVAVYASRIRFSRRIVARTVPAQSTPKTCRRTIIVAGDSTAFGVGALPAESTAGRLAAAFPHARVVNVARSGARIGHVTEQLAAAGVEFADLVLIHACANDVIEFRPLAKVEHDFCLAIARAKAISPNVVVMPGHNFAIAPFFLRPISWLVQRHGLKVHALVKRLAAELGVIFVDLVDLYKNEDPFYKEPRRYYCPDGLHPSAEGYGLWFLTLISQVPLTRFLADGGGSD